MLKIIAKDKIEAITEEIRKDPVKSKIVSIVEEKQPISYTELVELAMKETNLKKTSIKQKVAQLKNLGIFESKREGKKVLYYLSDLISI